MCFRTKKANLLGGLHPWGGNMLKREGYLKALMKKTLLQMTVIFLAKMDRAIYPTMLQKFKSTQLHLLFSKLCAKCSWMKLTYNPIFKGM